ncbi:hypothetical protein [Sinorhizobium meliloti]|uniref:hypothetical protein n=1 Tax=Rhizobium meliloti TaxID=382 RepID=UPI000B49BAD8|nr:hypothetical protein [Sinorhizobium meliloti]ASP92750.1 hypothetical protein CDO25_17405 [Sinorhizobium meliloti]MQX55955.1 hypothetical protein [Sinorhizobium meliloti]
MIGSKQAIRPQAEFGLRAAGMGAALCLQSDINAGLSPREGLNKGNQRFIRDLAHGAASLV